ncbi:hypothetical protein REPUB_Repub04eG0033400 [Reevesia pubescens]
MGAKAANHGTSQTIKRRQDRVRKRPQEVNNKMISAKKLIKLAKKWQKLAANRRKRITSSETIRFVLPLEYLKNEIVRDLFALAEEDLDYQAIGLSRSLVMQPLWNM